MGFWDFREKYWWKNFMHKLYSWGASVVLVGALFKLTHWPGATVMLTLGLLTEAFIFFMSGLEPPHEEYDWTLVFPELAGVTDEEELEKHRPGREKVMSRRAGASGNVSVEALAKFEEMLEKAGEGGLFEKLHSGLEKLSTNLESLKEITDTGLVTEEFNQSLKQASSKATEFSQTLEQSGKAVTEATEQLSEAEKKGAEAIVYSADNFADTLNKASQQVTENNEKLANAYNNLVNSMNIDFSILAEGNRQYNENITMLNKNLAAVNAIFEMQLEEANLEDMVKKISDSAQYADTYNKEVAKLAKQLQALNEVYGRMLSALNVKVD